ncbi:MAG: M2 family metallopeptidase [bacterium]
MTGNKEAEKTLKATLTAADSALTPLRNQVELTQWRAELSGTAKNFKSAQDAMIKYRRALNNPKLFEELTRRLTDPGIQDLMLRRWTFLLRHEMAPFLLDRKVVDDIIKREKKLEAKVTNFRPKVGGKQVTANRVAQILRSGSDIDERREAWTASKEIGLEVADEMRELVRARNLAARGRGFPDYYRMMLELQEIDEARLFGQLGMFASRSEDTFRRMKARMDRLLADKWGVDAIDLEPWHYSDPFFQEVPPILGADLDPIYQGRNTLDWVRSFFGGNGLSIAKIQKKGDYYERKNKSAGAFCTHIDRSGDVRVSLNLQENTYWAGVALHEFGHAVYELFLDKKLPHALRRPAHISTTEAIAMFFNRLVRNLEWMVEMFNLTGPQIRDLDQTLQEEQRMQMAVFGRWCLVMIHFERGLYRDPDQDQQQRWWDLVERFQLLRRPKGRENHKDWAVKSHLVNAPVYYQNYLLGEWQASMINNAMIRDLKLEEPVSWVKNREVGKWLKEKLFREGATWEFNELMRNATGSSVRPDEFLGQYFY